MTGVQSAYSTHDVARLMKVSQSHVINQMEKGLIPHFKVPGSKFRRISHRQLVDHLSDKPEYRFACRLLELGARTAWAGAVTAGPRA